jgi:hypothetical protein
MIRTLVGGDGARRPNTATLFCVPTNTRPLATVGTMNVLPAPNASRPPAARLELYSSRDRSDASYACSTAGFVFSTAHTIAFAVPDAEMLGVAPG